VTKQWTPAHVAAALALACTGACGGDDSAEADAGPGRDATLFDASSRDAAVVDCSGDHRESAEDTNDPFSSGDGSAERTGLTLAPGDPGFWVCGQLDPTQAAGMVVDNDAYEFTVDGDEPVSVRIELVASEANKTVIGLELHRIDDGPPMQVASVPFRNGYALIAGLEAQPGTYWVSAAALPPEPDAPLGYAILVRENPLSCAPAGPPEAYLEAGDEPAGRGNDTVHIHLPDPPVLTEEKDEPEPTMLVLEPDAVLLVRGESAAIESAGDSYLDRDTYLITTGAAASELEVRVSWPDGIVDLDVNLFAAGAPENSFSDDLGKSSGPDRDELMTLNVDPDHDYWLWVGAYDGGGALEMPVAYDITLCPREHVAPTPPR
jgi:hypothetical protein